MSMGNPDNPNAIKKVGKTAGAIQAKAIDMLTGVEEITVMERDTMKIRPVAGITRNAPGRTLTKANHGGTMMIQEKGSATHPMENTKTEFVIFRGNLLKDPSTYQPQGTITLKRKKQVGIGVKSLIN